MEKFNYSVGETDKKSDRISPFYSEVLNNLIKKDSNGLTEYHGGPLDLKDNSLSWLSPVEVKDEDGLQNFHILYINNEPNKYKKDRPTTLLFFDEMEMKLANTDNPIYSYLDSVISSDKPTIILRPVQKGMIHYPQVGPSDMRKEIFDKRLKKVISGLDLEIDTIKDFRKSQIHENKDRSYLSPFGNVIVKDIEIKTDQWKYYQLISKEHIHKKTNKKEDIPIRIDSGCDSGQLYLDKGCDCREQLHSALKKTIEDDGIIIHIPTHDGRGYGMATKMETEALKRGIRTIHSDQQLKPLDTIEAARKIFGESFDIRTYEGASRILKEYGYTSVSVYTNNKLKIKGIEEAGIKVIRRAIETINKTKEINHAEAKSKYKDIYFSK